MISTLFTYCKLTNKRCVSNCVWFGFECAYAMEEQLFVDKKKHFYKIVGEKIDKFKH